MMEMSIKMIEEMDKEKTKLKKVKRNKTITTTILDQITVTDVTYATNEVIEKSAVEAADAKAATVMIGKNQVSPEGNERSVASSSGV